MVGEWRVTVTVVIAVMQQHIRNTCVEKLARAMVTLLFDRIKAVELIAEMSQVCGIDLEKSSLIFMPKPDEIGKSADVELHILKAQLDFGSRKCLYALLDERKLKFKESPDKIMITDSP
jgi:hypothetical protein